MIAKVAALVIPIAIALLILWWVNRSTRNEMQNGDNIYW